MKKAENESSRVDLKNLLELSKKIGAGAGVLALILESGTGPMVKPIKNCDLATRPAGSEGCTLFSYNGPSDPNRKSPDKSCSPWEKVDDPLGEILWQRTTSGGETFEFLACVK